MESLGGPLIPTMDSVYPRISTEELVVVPLGDAAEMFAAAQRLLTGQRIVAFASDWTMVMVAVMTNGRTAVLVEGYAPVVCFSAFDALIVARDALDELRDPIGLEAPTDPPCMET